MSTPANLPFTMYESIAVGAHRVKDPGDAGTIKITSKSPAYVGLTSAAAETRTLAAPGFPGLQVTIALETDGGNVTLTVTDNYDQANNGTLTFDDAGDFVTFISVEVSTSACEWRILASNGIADAVVSGTGTVGVFVPDAQQETIAAGNPGAISVSTYLTLIGADVGGDAFTLADGTQVGQLKRIVMNDATGTGTVTLTTPVDENTLTFDAVGEAADVLWNGSGWRIIRAYNEATGGAGPGLSTV